MDLLKHLRIHELTVSWSCTIIVTMMPFSVKQGLIHLLMICAVGIGFQCHHFWGQDRKLLVNLAGQSSPKDFMNGDEENIRKLLLKVKEEDSEWLKSVFGDSIEDIFPETETNSRSRKSENPDPVIETSLDSPSPESQSQDSTILNEKVPDSSPHNNWEKLFELGYFAEDIASIRKPVLEVILERSIRRPRKGIPNDWLVKFSTIEETYQRIRDEPNRQEDYFPVKFLTITSRRHL